VEAERHRAGELLLLDVVAAFPGIAAIAVLDAPSGIDLRKRERDRHAVGGVRFRGRPQPRLRQPHGIEVDDGRRTGLVGEGKTPARRGHRAGCGHQHPAVVDGPARLVAHEVRVHVAAGEGP
jgi:hypothetical protein